MRMKSEPITVDPMASALERPGSVHRIVVVGGGAGLSSGRALYSRQMRLLFGLAADEQPLCFMTVGTVLRHKSSRQRPNAADYTSTL